MPRKRKQKYKKRPKNLRIILAAIIIGFLLIIGLTNPPEEEQAQKKETTAQDFIISRQEPTTPATDLEEIARGIQDIRAITVFQDNIYVSGKTAKAIYRLVEGKPEEITKLDFAYNIFFSQDGVLTAPIFSENRVVRVRPEGITTDFITNIPGPTALARDTTRYYVASFYDNNIISVRPDGTGKQTFIEDLDGPISIHYDQRGNSIYVANYNRPSVTRKRLFTYDMTQTNIFFPGLSHITNIYVDQDDQILVSATENGEGIIAHLDMETGTYQSILKTGLPDPIISFFENTQANGITVYLASPNDPQSRIFKATLVP